MALNAERTTHLAALALAIVGLLASCRLVGGQAGASGAQTTPAPSSTSCHLRELDLCAANLLVFVRSPSGGLATSEADMQKQCVHVRDAENCLRSYSRRCMTAVQRQLLTMATNTTSQMAAEYCTKGTQLRQTYLKHASCLDIVHRKDSKSCNRDLQVALEALSTFGAQASSPSSSTQKQQLAKDTSTNSGSQDDAGRRLQVACCTYRRYESCLSDIITKRCGREANQMVASLFRRATSRVPEVACRQYAHDGQECRGLLPKPGTQARGAKSNSIVSRLMSAYSLM